VDNRKKSVQIPIVFIEDKQECRQPFGTFVTECLRRDRARRVRVSYLQSSDVYLVRQRAKESFVSATFYSCRKRSE
jgi:hypothetical protein